MLKGNSVVTETTNNWAYCQVEIGTSNKRLGQSTKQLAELSGIKKTMEQYFYLTIDMLFRIIVGRFLSGSKKKLGSARHSK